MPLSLSLLHPTLPYPSPPQALMLLVPGYLAPGDDDAGHREYQELQMKLRQHQLPNMVVLQPVSHDTTAAELSSGSSSSSSGKGARYSNNNSSSSSGGSGSSSNGHTGTNTTMSGGFITHDDQQGRTEAALNAGGAAGSAGSAPTRARALST